MWQPSCQNSRGVRREKIRIVATKLLKIGGKKKRKKEKRNQLWQPSCQNWRGEKRENKNCGNQVAKNGRKTKEETNCGNQVAEIEGVRREKIRIVAEI